LSTARIRNTAVDLSLCLSRIIELRRLRAARIQAGAVGCVVGYKVDCLSRSNHQRNVGRWSDGEMGCTWPANITTGLYPYAISDRLNLPIVGIERRKRWPITYYKLRTRRKHGLPW
jgi:hypothetical protein